MDARHHSRGVEPVFGGVEVWSGEVLELNPPEPAIASLQEADLTRTQGALAIVDDSDLPRLVHTESPIRSR